MQHLDTHSVLRLEDAHGQELQNTQAHDESRKGSTSSYSTSAKGAASGDRWGSRNRHPAP
eukprot:1159040-Pelagomonas_calceolata.AAC.5